MDRKALILVVDDNAECRELLVWTLERNDFQVISAQSGREAVELAIKLQPELVLMDLSMPGMNGYEATRAIHAHRYGRKIPVVAVSADCVDWGVDLYAFKPGFTAFVPKPWDEEALLEIVTRLLTSSLERRRAA